MWKKGVGLSCGRQPQADVNQTSMHKKSLSPDLAIGAQPALPDLEELKKEGFRSVINLRRPDEPSPLNPEQEGRAVQSLGLEYRHLPVSSQHLDPTQADEFCKHIQDLPRPVFVHCQGGTRAGAFSLIHLGREKGWSGEQAFQQGEQAGFQCESEALLRFVHSSLEARKA